MCSEKIALVLETLDPATSTVIYKDWFTTAAKQLADICEGNLKSIKKKCVADINFMYLVIKHVKLSRNMGDFCFLWEAFVKKRDLFVRISR